MIAWQNILLTGVFAILASTAVAQQQGAQAEYDDQYSQQADQQESYQVDSRSTADQMEDVEPDQEPRAVGRMARRIDRQQARESAQLQAESSRGVRRFHEVLDELLAEFGYDVKMGQIKGLKNLAIRRIRVSKAIPKTYQDYLELLLSERIRENSRIRLVHCVPCKTRTSQVVDGKLLITSPATNLARLESAATMLGIEHFMDAVLVYHTTHMVLAVNVFNIQTKELVWARTYNSETIKSRYQKLAVDYSQVAKARPGEDYKPEYRFLFGFGGAAIPNVAGSTEDSTMVNLQVRASEKFNNRRDEFGMLLSVYATTRSLLNDYPTEGGSDNNDDDADNADDEDSVAQPKPFSNAFALYGLYGRLFVGELESYDRTRNGLHVGLGALLASGYIAPTLRGGWDIYFGRRFATSFSAVYIGPSSILIDGESIRTAGGFGADVVLSFNF